MFYFVDNNYPHEIYWGSQDDWNDLLSQGGNPARWNRPVKANLGECEPIQVKDPNTGENVVEQWLVRRYKN